MARVARAAETADDPLWRRYEQSVHELLAALDPDAVVLHDTKVPGRLSLTDRQFDVWTIGRVVGLDVSVGVECKRKERPVTVEGVDQFIGKLLDVGADRGVMYSYSGFTSSGVMRAASARNPAVLAVAVETPEIIQQLKTVPGYPADLLVQEFAPQWIEELDMDNFADWLRTAEWPKWWS